MKLFIGNFKKLWKYAENSKLLIFKCIVYNILFVAIRISVILLSARLIIKLTNNDMLGLFFTALLVFIIELTHNTIYYFLRGCY